MDATTLGGADTARFQANLGASRSSRLLLRLHLDRGLRVEIANLELHVDAVADHAGQRLGDQRAISVLEPILGEAIGSGDAEAVSSEAATAMKAIGESAESRRTEAIEHVLDVIRGA